MPELLKIAHRGASGHAPENTLAAFTTAKEMMVDIIELDVRVCGSGELVVFHDMTLERTTNGSGLVADMTLQELKSLNAGEGQNILTIQEAIEIIGQDFPMIIDMKGKGVAEPLAIIIRDCISRGYKAENFIVSSFDRKEFHRFASINPGTRLAILVGKDVLDFLIRAYKYKVFSIHLPYSYLRKWIVKLSQKRGYKVFVYTVNSIWEIARAKMLGVDGIISNYPDRI